MNIFKHLQKNRNTLLTPSSFIPVIEEKSRCGFVLTFMHYDLQQDTSSLYLVLLHIQIQLHTSTDKTLRDKQPRVKKNLSSGSKCENTFRPHLHRWPHRCRTRKRHQDMLELKETRWYHNLFTLSWWWHSTHTHIQYNPNTFSVTVSHLKLPMFSAAGKLLASDKYKYLPDRERG